MTDDIDDDLEVETVVYQAVPAVGPPPPMWDEETETWVETPAVVEVDPGTPAGARMVPVDLAEVRAAVEAVSGMSTGSGSRRGVEHLAAAITPQEEQDI